MRDLGRVADAPKGYGLGQRRFPLRASGEAVEHAGVSRTWCDGIDAHTRLGPFERRGLRQAFHGVLARGIDRGTGRPFVTVGRGYVDDAAVTLAPFLAKAAAVARPMPLNAPVINTTGVLILYPPSWFGHVGRIFRDRDHLISTSSQKLIQ